ncbi:serine protease HTRA3 [Procambarus clarkii]|uniref:serine protease HTRA3 n=1 Tax=Procambarus clarkii TaxID=6728 RepID=UPI001E67473C|nr:serine protease HTRA3-like [Procambarus clarkii]
MMLSVISLTLITASAALTALRPETLECVPCSPSRCPAIGECPLGITWDVCNCCEVCAKELDEECGGPWSAYGKCGPGLTCLKDARECPYLFHPRGSPADTGSDICDHYLFNAIGRCVASDAVMESAFKRNIVKEATIAAENQRNTAPAPLKKFPTMAGRRLMMKDVLRAVEY